MGIGAVCGTCRRMRGKSILVCNENNQSNLEDSMGYNVIVEAEKCVGCGECVDVCPVEVYEMKEGKSDPVSPEECLGCESCVEVCETSAITVEEN